MEAKVILEEKDIKRAIEEYLLSQGQGKVKSVRLEHGNNRTSTDPREFSNFYAEVELEAETNSTE